MFVDEHDNVDNENSSNYSNDPMTTNIICLATHIPSNTLIAPLMALVEPALQGDNPYLKKGAYVCMAAIGIAGIARAGFFIGSRDIHSC